MSSSTEIYDAIIIGAGHNAAREFLRDTRRGFGRYRRLAA
jgi:hypothetical protein